MSAKKKTVRKKAARKAAARKETAKKSSRKSFSVADTYPAYGRYTGFGASEDTRTVDGKTTRPQAPKDKGRVVQPSPKTGSIKSSDARKVIWSYVKKTP